MRPYTNFMYVHWTSCCVVCWCSVRGGVEASIFRTSERQRRQTTEEHILLIRDYIVSLLTYLLNECVSSPTTDRLSRSKSPGQLVTTINNVEVTWLCHVIVCRAHVRRIESRSGPGRASGLVCACVCVLTVIFELNDLWRRCLAAFVSH